MALYNCGAKRLANLEIVEFIEQFGYDRGDFQRVVSAHNCPGKVICCPNTGQCLKAKEAKKLRWEAAICLN